MPNCLPARDLGGRRHRPKCGSESEDRYLHRRHLGGDLGYLVELHPARPVAGRPLFKESQGPKALHSRLARAQGSGLSTPKQDSHSSVRAA